MELRIPRIVVTQGEGAEGSLAASLAARGAEVVPVPTIRIEPPADAAPLDRALEAIASYDWIVFTSRHAVEAVISRPAWESARAVHHPGLRVAALGKATAKALAHAGVVADLVPEEAGGQALAATMAEDQPLSGVRVLWPRSDIARREMPEALRAGGAEVVEPIAYRTVRPAGRAVETVLEALASGTLDAVTFMSPSSARNLALMLDWADLARLAGRTVVASIGPTTSAALRELKAPPDVESSARTAEDLAQTLLEFLNRPARTGDARSPR